jgi:HPt (histidine-containing phosphotransfer) domain-containing protein
VAETAERPVAGRPRACPVDAEPPVLFVARASATRGVLFRALPGRRRCQNRGVADGPGRSPSAPPCDLRDTAMTRPDEPASDAPPAAGGSAALLAQLDAASVQRLRDLDPDGRNGLVARILDTFVDSLSRHAGEFAQARAAGDRDGLRRVAHTLKSSSASVGALDLSRACADVERLVREGDVGALEAPLDRLAAHLQRLLALAGRTAGRPGAPS